MKTTFAASSLALSCILRGVNAIDFDFRDFEGLWQATNAEVVTFNIDPTQIPLPPGIAAPPFRPTPGQTVAVTSLGSVQCRATGDFRKAMCELTLIPEQIPICPRGIFNLKFSLDQFDADTGKTGILRGSGRCCDPATADKSLPNSGCFDFPFNPNFQMTMLPGKSNKHARAIDVTFAPTCSILMTMNPSRVSRPIFSYERLEGVSSPMIEPPVSFPHNESVLPTCMCMCISCTT